MPLRTAALRPPCISMSFSFNWPIGLGSCSKSAVLARSSYQSILVDLPEPVSRSKPICDLGDAQGAPGQLDAIVIARCHPSSARFEDRSDAARSCGAEEPRVSGCKSIC